LTVRLNGSAERIEQNICGARLACIKMLLFVYIYILLDTIYLVIYIISQCIIFHMKGAKKNEKDGDWSSVFDRGNVL
jgi:hypothetical protein